MNKLNSAVLSLSIAVLVVNVNFWLTDKATALTPVEVKVAPVEVAGPKVPEPADLITRETTFEYVNNDAVDIIYVSKASISRKELTCLATNIYHEARGESDVGKIAVAHVTLNRTFSEYYPDTICDVVYQARLSRWWLENKGREVPVRNQCQFSWYCDGRSDAVDANSQGWKDSVYFAMAVLVEKYGDPTYGATHYYNHNIVKPDWSHVLAYTTRIDNHTFHTVY